MLVIAFAFLWGGYAVAYHAWTLWQGYDITFLQSIDPRGGGYQWPRGGPGPIPAGQVFPGKSSGGGGPAGSTPVPGSAAVKPKKAGKCPPGYLWDPGSGTCLKELG